MKKIVIAVLLAAICSCGIVSASAGNYDVNGDGKVTIDDATTIQRYIAGAQRRLEEVTLDDVASYLPREIEAIPYLFSEEIGEDEPYVIVDSSVLTGDILKNRVQNGILIIERVIAIVLDTEGNAKVLNSNGEFTRTKYKYTLEPIVPGTVLLTYLVYNPTNNKPDGIANRLDYVIDRRFEL